MAPPSQEIRAEIAATARLAAPVILVHLGMMLMGTVDIMMLGRYSDQAMAAAGLGFNVTMALVVFPMGLLMGIDPLAAQAHGAGDVRRLARYFRQALILAVVLAVPISVVMWFSRPLLELLRQPPELAGDAAVYLRTVIPSNVAFLLYVALRQTLQAMSIVRPVFVAIVAGNVVNALVNWLLIFGHAGFPALGVAGAGWAMTLSRWAMVLWLVVAARRTLAPYWAAPRTEIWRPRAYATFLRLGAPVGVHISIEHWLFSSVALMMGFLGTEALAGHQVALNLAALAFMVPLGIGAAASTRVGNAIGRSDPSAMRRAAGVSLGLGVVMMSGSVLLFAVVPRFLARLYTPEPAVIAVAASLLPIAAIFQISDGLQVVSSGILRGAADTRWPALIALVGYWLVALPAAIWMAFGMDLGPRGLWWGLTIGLVSVAFFLLLRLRRRFREEILAVADDDFG